ncbi:hypothetical protein NPIL_580891 [Nephila pilipes]|uniref:Uncharacterized protein n=1 Tax=Nephila pilipes TaxID=299642 RepID=A0A8X6QN33_NEPPI|nr:hypothetical protein NPIL_580891 [Nephila pilipes]
MTSEILCPAVSDKIASKVKFRIELILGSPVLFSTPHAITAAVTSTGWGFYEHSAANYKQCTLIAYLQCRKLFRNGLPKCPTRILQQLSSQGSEKTSDLIFLLRYPHGVVSRQIDTEDFLM